MQQLCQKALFGGQNEAASCSISLEALDHKKGIMIQRRLLMKAFYANAIYSREDCIEMKGALGSYNA
jgi:hypothetical protein